MFDKTVLHEIKADLENLFRRLDHVEATYSEELKQVHKNYTYSAKNLIHYFAIGEYDADRLFQHLKSIGLGPLPNWKSNVLRQLTNTYTIICSLLNNPVIINNRKVLSDKECSQLINEHTEALLGKSPEKRQSRILVTQPTISSENSDFAKELVDVGMDCARVNCAHDTPEIWEQIINNIRSVNQHSKIMMDLGGPKLRTGKMKPGHKVIHVKPKRNPLGQVTVPAKVWLAPFGILPPEGSEVDAVIPVNKKWLRKTRKGSYIRFIDSRGKKCKIVIEKKEGLGRWASCSDSAFVSTGTQLTVFIEKKSTSELHTVHEILPLEEVIYLFEGDYLILNKEPIPGEPTMFDQEGNIEKLPHISCTLPEIFNKVKPEEPIYFDDGKIEGQIKEVYATHLKIRISNTKKNGGKLKADKGINLPNSKLDINGLTSKDKEDLKFVLQHADALNFSFVNNKEDVEDLLQIFKAANKSVGIILKIETKTALQNMASILLTAMQNYPVGVMIARGDLAIETGWKNFGMIQEELLAICEAAHLPSIWATQVLENLAKKGIPTRAEITDVSMAQRAHCIMLNKGPYIEKAIKMLDKILIRSQGRHHQEPMIYPKIKMKV